MTTAMVKQELAVASFSTVYDLEQVETALSDLNESASDALRATYERMLKTGNLRFCVKPNRMPSFDALGEALPNFAEPLEDVRKQVALCLETEDRLELMPILLLSPGHRQDALREGARATARHRVPLRADEFADGRLDPVGCVVAMEEREARQGVRCTGERQLREPGDRGRRDRQGRQRCAIRSARRAVCVARARHRARIHRRIRGSADRCGQRDLDRDRERGARDPGAAAQPDERVRDRAARRGRRAPDRADDLRRDPHVACVGRRFPDTLGDDALDVLAATPRARCAARCCTRSAPHGSTGATRSGRATSGPTKAPRSAGRSASIERRAHATKAGAVRAAQCRESPCGARHARRRRETLHDLRQADEPGRTIPFSPSTR